MTFEKQERQPQQLEVGAFEARVVNVNPTLDELYTWRGWEKKEDSKEPVYVGEDRDKNTRVTIEIGVEAVDTGKKYQKRFMLTDKKSVSEKSGKQQYVNQLGMSTWVDDKVNLPQWFTHLCDKDKKPVAELDWRSALQGEADIYEFMRNWLGKVNWFSATTNVLLDTKKLLRGNMSEISNLITAPTEDNLTDTITLMATVYIKDTDDGKKMYQNIANVYMRGYLMKNVRLAAATNSWAADKSTKRFMEQCTGTYGIQDAYYLGPIKPFVEDEHLQATDKVIDHGSSTSTEPVDTDW